MIGLGGSGGTALITPAMQALPVGTPKVMVSTVASGNVAPYVGPCDICMMYSVTDVAGLNRISRRVLGNAAHALAGMMAHQVPQTRGDRPAVGLTMFGVTTPCVEQVSAALEADYDCLVFHATGTGGQSMEKLVDSGLVVGVIDVTTTEVCDLLMGGVFSAGEDRLGAIARTGVPYVGSCGALDMVNFGAIDTVPGTLSRAQSLRPQPAGHADAHDARRRTGGMGEWIGAKLNACAGEVRFLIPEGGVSMIDAPGQPFHDPAADAALFEALEATVEQTPRRRLIRAAAPPQRSRVRPGAGRELPRDRALAEEVMPRFEREALLERFRGMVARREPIVGGGAGTGLSAKCEEAGGIDLIVIYNSGRYRMAGRGSLAGLLAYGNANEIVLEMAKEVLPVVARTPVLAGVNGTDPFLIMDDFLERLKRLGFSGVQNFPTVGLIDGTFRANLEETGMGYGLEVEMIRRARAHDLLTTPYVFSADEARAMTAAGADMIVCHMGLTTGGAIGAGTALRLEDCPKLIDQWAEAALGVRKDVIVLCHGGPIALPEDAAYVLRTCQHCHGFYGASSMERLPTEIALTEQTRKFKALSF